MKVAIVGCGRIGRVHAAAVAARPEVGGVIFCDADRDAAARTAARMPGALWYPDPALLLARERPDVVHVCTPPATHATVARMALAAGAHVLVEKPLALSSAELQELAGAVRSRPWKLCVDHNLLFEPEMLAARRWVSEGRIGAVLGVDVFYGVYRGAGDAGPGDWSKALPGGRFTDVLPHGVSLVRAFLGEVQQVQARSGGAAGVPPTELHATLLCDGGLGSVHVSLATVPWTLTCRVRGSTGTIDVDLARQRALCAVPAGDGIRGRVRLAADLARQRIAATGGWIAGKASGRLRGYPGLRELVGRFYDALAAGDVPPVTFADGAAVATAVERIVQRADDQARTRAVVVPLRQTA